MSRAYRIELSDSLRQRAVVSDGIDTRLDILPILSKEEMGKLVAEELKLRDFKERTDGKWQHLEPDGVMVVIDTEENTIEVRLQKETEIEVTKKISKVVEEEYEKQEKQRLQEKLQESLKEEAKEKQSHLQKEVTELLSKKLNDLQKEFDNISNKVVANALKKRAAQIGEIENIEEDSNSGSLTIRVRV